MIANSHILWKVKYEPGELLAKGVYRSREVVTRVVTASAATALSLVADRQRIMADGRDVSVVKVSVMDAKGNVVPLADNEIEFNVSGPGKLLGVGNGNPASHEPDKCTKRCAFNGWCLALVQSTGKPGSIKLEGKSNGLKVCTVEILAE
jgi:beta-galactosidase